ncbi:hypothetical protein E2C01_070751 [Portunus trituberculatus]|uniref:Uncharacterized protein n=1 Tax=Portunus trituberculatus TaxID=210409 RepID=A0A5B7HTJ5_PORTR|nr:hypothetical protein [Portunus trituberculatus]
MAPRKALHNSGKSPAGDKNRKQDNYQQRQGKKDELALLSEPHNVVQRRGRLARQQDTGS